MANSENCTSIESEHDLEKILKTKEACFILFYAAWCPFSQRFLPIFKSCSKDADHTCYQMTIDEYPHLCEKYLVEVYPTVLFFRKGKVVKRLDGTHGIGLDEQQFRGLLKECRDVKE
jgi:thiol-disulfide isomerase/thioredoxin